MSELEIIIAELKSLREELKEIKDSLVKRISPKLSADEAQIYVDLGRDTFKHEVTLGRIKKHIGANGYAYYLDYELNKYMEH